MTGDMVAAGFIDLQVNGGWGHDFTADPSSIWEVGRHLPATGVTTFLPTIVSAPYHVVDKAIEVLRRGPPTGYLGADPIGLHIEGPWISPGWKGAHNPDHLVLPDPDVAQRWAGSGMVRMVTIAPELDRAFDVAGILAGGGVVVSAGHSGADFETGAEALLGPWGAVTHLYNQMSPFHHRSPGLVGAALLSDRACGLIVDGIHSAPAAVRLAWDRLGPDRFTLITDGMQATGLGEGIYILGDREVVVGSDGPRISRTILAGSTLTMDRALANLTAWTTATTDQGLASASLVPARLLGLDDRGALGDGMRDDRVLLDSNLRVAETVVDGDVAYRAEDH
ncbi:MAG: N-acetylglucosamine-6-phosphate deacetylase [Acidimicrobiia bacterium]